MVNISHNGFIVVHRGDSFKVPLFINQGTKSAPTRLFINQHPGANIYLGVMEPNQPFEKAVIKKKFSYKGITTEQGDLEVHFKPSDTEYLLPGKYYYSIKAEVLQVDHNLNYSLKKAPYILVYGWTDERSAVSAREISMQFRPGKVVEVVGVSTATKAVVPLYVQADVRAEQRLVVYSSCNDQGVPSGELEVCTPEDLAAQAKSVVGDTVVDTIVPPTEFVIYE